METLSNRKSNQHWFLRYKLYHIPFWCVNQYFWWSLSSGNPLEVANAIFFSTSSVKFLFYVIFLASGVYFNLYFLIPRYLEKSRFTAYILYLAATIFCTAILILPAHYLSVYFSPKTLAEVYGERANYFFYFLKTYTFPSTIGSMTLAMSIKLTKNWVQSKRRQQLLEKEKLETELKFLKYQFNPHFLFNTINSIFFLIHKNPDMASASLAKFSELLRYQLYECNDKQIPLNKEMAYLENFVELEKLRHNKNVEITIQTEQAQSGYWGIAPFILMTFVENAFKHVSRHSDQPNWIRIMVEVEGQQLHFAISNSTSPHASTDVLHYGGIGLPNVQRRLDLLYPEKYDLAIENNNTSFEVKLRLQLSEVMLAQPSEVLAYQ